MNLDAIEAKAQQLVGRTFTHRKGGRYTVVLVVRGKVPSTALRDLFAGLRRWVVGVQYVHVNSGRTYWREYDDFIGGSFVEVDA